MPQKNVWLARRVVGMMFPFMMTGLEMSDHEQACWDESYGYRPNGQGGPTPEEDHGIYAKDLNGDWLNVLTPALMDELEIKLIWEG